MPTFAYTIKVTHSGMHSHDYKKGRKVFEGDYASGEVCAKDESCAEREVRSNFNKDLGGSTDYKVKLTKISNEPRWSEDGLVSGKDKATSRSYHSDPSDAAAGAALIVVPILAVAGAAWLTWKGIQLGYKGVKYLHEQAPEAAAEAQKAAAEAKRIEDAKPAHIKALEAKRLKQQQLLAKQQAEESLEQFGQFLIYFGLTFSVGFSILMMTFAVLKVSHVI